MASVRMNITLPEELAHELDELVGPKKKSKFIFDAVKRRIQEIRQQELERRLEDGYKDERKESHFLAKEFESIDLEGWDEY
jgi:metal-responsive CopG/Arc/MetJ family transcriptional regulator